MVLWVSPWCWAIWLLFQDLSLGWRFVCLLIRCVYLRGCFGCCGKIRAPCILFSLIARKRGPPWQRLREMHAFRAEAGRIFVPCIRFGVQSGDFGYIARESCQGGPFFASRSLESCMGRRSCRRSTLRGPLRSGGQNKGPCCVRKGHAHVAFIPSIGFPRYEKAEEGGNLAVYGKRPMRSREVSSPFAEELALKSLALPFG